MTASNRPTTVHLSYYHEEGSWWAESDQLPGLFAGGDSLDDARALARQVVADELGDDMVIAEWMPVPSALEKFLVGSPHDPTSKAGALAPRTVRSWPDESCSQSVEAQNV